VRRVAATCDPKACAEIKTRRSEGCGEEVPARDLGRVKRRSRQAEPRSVVSRRAPCRSAEAPQAYQDGAGEGSFPLGIPLSRGAGERGSRGRKPGGGRTGAAASLLPQANSLRKSDTRAAGTRPGMTRLRPRPPRYPAAGSLRCLALNDTS
jgi:hypothetical protein